MAPPSHTSLMACSDQTLLWRQIQEEVEMRQCFPSVSFSDWSLRHIILQKSFFFFTCLPLGKLRTCQACETRECFKHTVQDNLLMPLNAHLPFILNIKTTPLPSKKCLVGTQHNRWPVSVCELQLHSFLIIHFTIHICCSHYPPTQRLYKSWSELLSLIYNGGYELYV